MQTKNDRPYLAVTLGDPNGVGPLLAAMVHRELGSVLRLVFVGAERSFDGLDWVAPRTEYEDARSARAHNDPERLAFVPCPCRQAPSRGTPNADFAPAIIDSIQRATQWALEGEVDAIVTAPVSKKLIIDGGFAFSGHTFLLGQLTNSLPVMMLISESMRTVPITGHVPLREVASLLTPSLILDHARIAARSLQEWFDIKKPRLGLVGLNPHAGEHGALGDEELNSIEPARQSLSQEGIDVGTAVLSADTAFTPANRERYDVFMCMTHDHALIPLKVLDFSRGVNCTLGLPIIRTSPDHGVAWERAKHGDPNGSAMIMAARMAAQLARHRRTLATQPTALR